MSDEQQLDETKAEAGASALPQPEEVEARSADTHAATT